MMAIRDHNVLLRQQVLDTILRDDILNLRGVGRGRCQGSTQWELSKRAE